MRGFEALTNKMLDSSEHECVSIALSNLVDEVTYLLSSAAGRGVGDCPRRLLACLELC